MRSHHHSSRALLAFLTAGALVAGGEAHATPPNLSNTSMSNIGNDRAFPAAALSATLDFELTDPSTLTLTVSNDSADLDIVAIYLNAAGHVTALSLESAPKRWTLGGDPDTGAFGVFGFVLCVPDEKAKKDEFDAGDTAVFVLGIAGTGPFAESDFTGVVSGADRCETADLAEASVVGGGLIAVGANHAPEPATGFLLALGLLGLAIARRRSWAGPRGSRAAPARGAEFDTRRKAALRGPADFRS